MISRRRFLKASGAVSGAVLGFPAVARSSSTIQAQPGQKPRHIIYMVADGMGPCTLTCGDYLSHLMRQRGLAWIGLHNHPAAHLGLMNMRSLNSYVTDSAAASSSWGSGSRINNGAINQLPDGTPLKTIYELFAEEGWKRGLVTTTELTHATPAGFVACVEKRDHAAEIARQYLDRRVEVLLGGGQKFFSSTTREDKRDLYGKYETAGYEVMKDTSELSRAGLNQPWLGTFSLSHFPFTVDWRESEELRNRVPTLATMTRRALDWLQRHDHFILQVEGGRVDHGAHNNDAASTLAELVAFDEAIDVVLAFQREVPDTLVVITTDHGTGGLALNGMGSGYADSNKLMKNVLQAKASIPEILRVLRKKPAEQTALAQASPSESAEQGGATEKDKTDSEKKEAEEYSPEPAEVLAVLEELTGYKPSERRAGLFLPYLSKKGDPLFGGLNSDTGALGQLLANHVGIGWTSTAHTAEFAPILAVGPGAERFRGFIENVSVFRHFTQMAGINYWNPRTTEVASLPASSGQEENIAEYAEKLA